MKRCVLAQLPGDSSGVRRMRDDFSKYQAMRDAGSAPEEVYGEAARDGLDTITLIRLVRVVYSRSLGEAKEVWVRAERLAESRTQHEEVIADAILLGAGKKEEVGSVPDGRDQSQR
jgi:hypothetical protein